MTDPASKIRLIVVFGGLSAEHEVSCTTATHVLAAARPDRYDIEAIGITKSGQFVVAEEAMAVLADGARSLPPSLAAEGPSTDLSIVVREAMSDSSSTPVSAGSSATTVVLPLLHGPFGEDGTIQGMLEMAGVPYVGAGVLASSVIMDKVMSKTVCDAVGIAQTRWMALHEADTDDGVPSSGQLDSFVETLGFPIFVKPANMGSSVGVGKADTLEELAAAIAVAFRYDEMLVLEEGVDAREIELAVLGNHEVRVSLPGEIKPAADFYDYDDKYKDGAAELLIPAPLSDEMVAELQRLAEQAYRALRCEGMARADFLVEEGPGGRGPLLNELNSIPGFTPISMYPKMWEASGLSYPDLIDELVRLAIERHARRATKRGAS